MNKQTVLTTIALIALVGFSNAARDGRADDWGTLSGRFIFDGKAPAAEAITPNKDLEVCGKHPLVDESLVVGPRRRVGERVRMGAHEKCESRAGNTRRTPRTKSCSTIKIAALNRMALAMRTTQQLEVKNARSRCA